MATDDPPPPPIESSPLLLNRGSASTSGNFHFNVVLSLTAHRIQGTLREIRVCYFKHTVYIMHNTWSKCSGAPGFYVPQDQNYGNHYSSERLSLESPDSSRPPRPARASPAISPYLMSAICSLSWTACFHCTSAKLLRIQYSRSAEVSKSTNCSADEFTEISRYRRLQTCWLIAVASSHTVVLQLYHCYCCLYQYAIVVSAIVLYR
eukprot:COSAG02_NODE_1384_length_12956_cov_126.308446_1_plen_206_part_00